MEPIANCMHAIPIPYRFQYEKCKKKSWELQAYTYTAFVAPLHKFRKRKIELLSLLPGSASVCYKCDQYIVNRGVWNKMAL